MAKYRLYITKTKARTYAKDGSFRFTFSVLDMEKGMYPLAWVCTFPKNYNSGFFKSVFASLASNNPLEFAYELLTAALQQHDDIEIRQEINNRLEHLSKSID